MLFVVSLPENAYEYQHRTLSLQTQKTQGRCNPTFTKNLKKKKKDDESDAVYVIFPFTSMLDCVSSDGFAATAGLLRRLVVYMMFVVVYSWYCPPHGQPGLFEVGVSEQVDHWSEAGR